MTLTLDKKLASDVEELLTMLMYKRPSGGKGEQAFIHRYVLPLGAEPDEAGNHWLTIGESPVLFSCHTDTVHDKEGVQLILYGAGVASAEDSECLGADCGTGVWLMSQMIKAGIEGTYVFHADEEVGGLGSEYVATHLSERLAGIKFAIAFDRKGTTEIITHQGMRRCCSDAFAESLADILSPLQYDLSDKGSFTDTANYTKIVPECTNIGVGYYKQHTPQEHQDVLHALALRDALIRADWSKLVCERDPSVKEVWGKGLWVKDSKGWKYAPDADPDGPREDDMLADFIRRHANEVASFILDMGYDQNDLEEYIYYGDVA